MQHINRKKHLNILNIIIIIIFKKHSNVSYSNDASFCLEVIEIFIWRCFGRKLPISATVSLEVKLPWNGRGANNKYIPDFFIFSIIFYYSKFIFVILKNVLCQSLVRCRIAYWQSDLYLWLDVVWSVPVLGDLIPGWH